MGNSIKVNLSRNLKKKEVKVFKSLIFSILFLFALNILQAHEGHDYSIKQTILQINHQIDDGQPDQWIKWVGSFHLILLHFPIALIFMTVVSELLYYFNPRLIYDYSSRFMLIAAAILTLPTAILGFIYSYSEVYTGLEAEILWWHMWAGIISAILVIVVAFIQEKYGRVKIFYITLFLLFLVVSITGHLGGMMAFGPDLLIPPIKKMLEFNEYY